MVTEAKDEIKKMREEAGMTQKAFSDFFGIPVRTLQDWEAGFLHVLQIIFPCECCI